jgi:hypothetical protein
MKEKIVMTTPQTTTTAEGSLGRDVLYAARYYLGNRWTLVAVAGLAVAIGLSFGGWGWLVAAGLVPILLSTLPCLIMCGFGVCMMCRSGEKKFVSTPDAAGTATSSSALGIAKIDDSSASAASCCSGQVNEAKSPQVAGLQPLDERKNSHA